MGYEKLNNIKELFDQVNKFKNDPARAKANDALVAKEDEERARLANKKKPEISKSSPIKKDNKHRAYAELQAVRFPNPD